MTCPLYARLQIALTARKDVTEIPSIDDAVPKVHDSVVIPPEKIQRTAAGYICVQIVGSDQDNVNRECPDISLLQRLLVGVSYWAGFQGNRPNCLDVPNALWVLGFHEPPNGLPGVLLGLAEVEAKGEC